METHAGFAFTVERKRVFNTTFYADCDSCTSCWPSPAKKEKKKISIFLRFLFDALLDFSLFHKALYAAY